MGWGNATTALTTAADGVRLLSAGRSTSLPWLGIRTLNIKLDAPAAIAASDINVTGIAVADYGPVTIAGSGTSYTIALARPINSADRVTVTIGNGLVATFKRRLDVLPGDVNDDGNVNAQDIDIVRNVMLGATYNLVADVNGDGVVDLADYNLVRKKVGTRLP